MNLSDAFDFEEQEKIASDPEGLEMKTLPHSDILAVADRVTETETDASVGDSDRDPQTGTVVNPS